MREILFRGKRKGVEEWEQEWIFGDLMQIPTHNFCSIIEQTACAEHCEVIPETVGQYTGLTDKNGTKIFEDDIVLVGGVQKAKISFENGCFRVSCFALNILCDRKSECEVIGNIHDNPELLEDE